jgi:hypothetical protein
MTYHASPSVPDSSLSSSRSAEFAEALDRYIASYAAPERLRHHKSTEISLADQVPRSRDVMRRLTGFIAGGLMGLGSAMSAGGRTFSVGIM